MSMHPRFGSKETRPGTAASPLVRLRLAVQRMQQASGRSVGNASTHGNISNVTVLSGCAVDRPE
jgi:hypothetical protein